MKRTQEVGGSIAETLLPGRPSKYHRLGKPEQFRAVYSQGRTQVDRFLVLKAKSNDLDIYRFGISISRRVGKAVIRNRIKRKLREIVRLSPPVGGWDIVFIVRNPAVKSDYHQLKKSIASLLSRASIPVE